MTRKYFGTDGVRTRANTGALTPGKIVALGQALGHYFKQQRVANHTPMVVIGKDTRQSGYMIETALQSGLMSVGVNCILFGPMPTPGVAMLTRSMRADMGVMITASHNAFHDNGIKLFSPDGYKLPDEVEKVLEGLMDDTSDIPLSVDKEIGRAKRIDDAPGRYVEYCKSTLPKDFRLDGLKIVLDCANGATYHVARAVFWELGADVVELIHAAPNGQNINEACGALHPEDLQAAVRAHKADIGLAFDGDGDRVMMVDEQGNIVDGEQVLAAIALNWQKSSRLKQNAVVGTIMNNVGLEKCLADAGITLHRAPVGDRYVTEMLKSKGLNFGGEPSGHIICMDFNTCGDGIVTGLQALKVMREAGCKASALGKTFKPYPQKLENIRFGAGVSAEAILADVRVKEAVVETEKMLAGHGRIVLRKSGTEPLVRLMIEADTEELLNKSISSLANVIRSVAA